MPTFKIWRTYSVFISSTFADMQIERDYLKNEIFPRIEEKLRERRIKLDIVDLRWGVDTTSLQQEDERERLVLKVCLEEIKNCKPFFIGLLGDRYGWMPDEEKMKQAIEEQSSEIDPKGKSVTALEIEFGVLANKEQLKRSFFYFRKPLDYTKLPPEKYGMYCDEYNEALTGNEKVKRKTALKKIKDDIKEHFEKAGIPHKVKEYSIELGKSKDENKGLIEWGETVYKDILEDAERYAEATWNEFPKNWEEREHALLEEFVNDHIYGFCGRTNLLEELKQHLLTGTNTNWGIVLTGASGSGKSSVFAKIYDDLVKEKGDYLILAHSAGISPRSKNIIDFLQIWIRQLWNFLEYKGNPLEEFEQKEISRFEEIGLGEKQKPKPKIEELQEKFTELLFKAADKKRVIILIDALDRFEPTPRAKYMSWFPAIVPQNMRMLCTVITGNEKNVIEYHKGGFAVKSIDSFSPKEAEDMLNTLIKLGHKKISPKISKTILSKKRGDHLFAASSPLWLSLAVNIMMALDKDDFEKMSGAEKRVDINMEEYMVAMVNNFPTQPGELFISLIYKAKVLFGKEFTEAVFNFIAVSRNGLREKDLEKLIPDWEPLKYAALRRWFRAHLIKQSEELQWSLTHSILRSTLIDKIEKDNYKKLNNAIGSHLLLRPDTDALHISETMYHLMEADNKQKAAEYYGSELSDEEVSGAAKVLAEAITSNKYNQSNPYVEWVAGMYTATILEYAIKRKVGERIQFHLYEVLEKEGNIEERTILLQKILPIQKRLYNDNPGSYLQTYDLAMSFFKLGDLYKTEGNLYKALNIFEECHKLSKELYKANPKNESTKNNLAKLYSKFGELFQTIGQSDIALVFFEKDLKLIEELYRANPKNESIKFNLAASYFELGELFQTMSQLDKAFDFFEKDLKLIEELNKANPKNESIKINLAKLYGKFGELFQTKWDLDKALGFFEKRRKLSEELNKANPKNELIKNGLAVSYSQISELFQIKGNLNKARNFLIKGTDLFEELHKANMKGEYIKENLALSYSRLGDLFVMIEQLDKALYFYEKSGQLFEELNKANPKAESFKNNLATFYERLGDLFLIKEQLDKALGFFEKSRRFIEELYKENPKKVSYKGGLAKSYSKLGDLYKTKGNLDKALDFYEKSGQLFEELYKANRDNESFKSGLGISYERLGNLFVMIEQLDKALDFYEKSRQLNEELYKENPYNESHKYLLAVLYERLGDLFLIKEQLDKALGFFEKQRKLSEELYKVNPNNINFSEALGASYFKLGVFFITMQKDKEGKEYLHKSCSIFRQLFTDTKIPKYKQWFRYIINDYGIE